MNTNIAEIVTNLLSKQKEGDYWDFKQSYNDDPVRLVHDIICLANNPYYSGERYLIYGVDDKKYEVSSRSWIFKGTKWFGCRLQRY